jgi:hypothetical protein
MPDVRRRFLMMNTGTARYTGMTSGRRTPALTVDTVVALLAIKVKSIPLEYANEALEVNRPDSGHVVYLMLIVRWSTDTNSGALQPSPSGL